MKKTFDPLFVLYCTIWLVVHLFRFIGKPLPWVNNWLTDFIFIPVAAHIALTFTRYVLKRPAYRYPLGYLLLVWLYTSMVCEWLLPLFSQEAVGDKFDVLAYLAGSLFYCYIHQNIDDFTWSQK